MHKTEQLNTALADRYVVEHTIGEGGMATVYLARDLRHNRHVALKVLKAELGAILGVERFLSEIQVTANLQHPNLLPLFDSGEADGLLFYVMPFVEGESLRARLDREKQLPIDEAVHIAVAIAGALDYAHGQGVIHRDLKPENILLQHGQPVLADFGIALAVSNAGGNRITQTGLSLGTPQYMSPEQATGDRVIDARSDIYSLGAVTYEMLTGEAPHTGTTSQAIIARVLTERPRSIRATRPSVPEHVEAAVMHALEKLAPDRFATAKEFGEALTGARAVVPYTGAPTTQRPVTAVIETRGSRTRERIVWLVAIAAIAAWAMTRASKPAPPPPFARTSIEMPEGVTITAAGNVAVVALSPDGSTMVVQGTSAQSGLALYVRRMDDPTMQVIRGTEGGIRPSFSPDGNDILFIRDGLFRIPVRGGTPRPLADSAGLASWGDNHEIVYPWKGSLYVVGDDGGVPRLVSAPDTTRKHVSYSWPDMLPGGKAALIDIRVGENSLDSVRLGVVSLETGRVTEFSPVIHGTNPRYSPTGHVLYVSPDGILFAVPFSTKTLRVTGPPIHVSDDVATGSGGAAAFAVARGGLIVLRSGSLTGKRQFVRMTRAGGAATPIGPGPGYYRTPRVSPDGRTVAYTTFYGGGPAGPIISPDIWLFDLQSNIPRRLTTDSASIDPAWSPDGERIAYIRTASTGQFSDSVMWRPVKTTAPPTLLLKDARLPYQISFGTLHGHIAVSVGDNHGRRNHPVDILLGAADSPGQLTPFAAEAYDEQAASISPDDRLVAYVTNRTGTNEVVVRPVLGNETEVQVSIGGGGAPVWSRDGHELFYRVPGYLLSAHLSGGAVPAVVSRDTLFRDDFPFDPGEADYDVFPDGKSFVLMQMENVDATQSLSVLMNWRPGASNER